MRLFFFSFLVVFFLIVTPHQANSACCAWDDRDACASCPDGYWSGCVTNGTKCDCDCSKSSSETAEKMSYGNSPLQQYIKNNIQRIIKDTNLYRYHDYQGTKISITPPK